MTTKTYKLINALSLRTCVTVAGKQLGIRFEGGTCDSAGRIIRPGALTTSDPELQKAIEADGLYGKMFTTTIVQEEPKTEPETDLNNDPSDGVEPETDLNNDPSDGVEPETDLNTGTEPNKGKNEVAGITNTQMAVEWLTTHKEVKFDRNPKAADVKAKAAELGVAFTEWK